MDISALFSPAFWEHAWNEAIAADRERSNEKRAVDVWNRRARNYDKNVGSESGSRRVEEALAFLDAYGVLKNKLRILDLGCGPGNFTIAFAERGHEVVALDPAEKMLAMLEEKLQARPDLRPRVTAVAADWVPLIPSEYGWDNHFDLVFASMTPGVKDVATLEKAMAVSKRYLYLSRFAGPRLQPSVEAIWSQFNAAPYYSLSLDILFPLNWLYAAGHRPVQHFSHWQREHCQPVDEAVDEIINVLALRLDVDESVERAVRLYVETHAESGRFCEQKGATSAMLLWDKSKHVLTR